MHFDPSRFEKADVRLAEVCDAIIVERQKPGEENGLVRWLRKSAPEVPLIAYGDRTDQRSVFAAHLSEVPRRGVLRSLVQDARRHLATSRKASELSRRVRETSHRLQVLGEIVSTANSILDPRRVVNVIMSQIQQLIPSEAWSILLVDEETGELVFEMALGEKSADLSDIRIKIGEGVAGWVAETGEPAIVNNVHRDRRFQNRFDQLTQFETRSILCAPLISRGRTLGVVEIMNRASGSRFTKKDMNLLLTLVEPAAIALENAFLFQKTEQLAVTDDLTKLYNSRYLNSFLEDALGQAKKMGSSLAVVFLDLDGFKSINDRYGHFYGSRALYEVGALLRDAVREEDIVSRYGGDEFVIVLPDTDGKGALAAAERVRTALKSHVFLSEFDLAARLSASFGVSLYPDHGHNPQDLMQKADQAMYSVKERGKDAICLSDSLYIGGSDSPGS
ncbi:MAG TPA: sensor domain-containing diguanylate cyclase [Vicinamibacteria bacterium]|nr:sensor domain-containing diguanylate cyclase [Vicinamibacteria bacterium]